MGRVTRERVPGGSGVSMPVRKTHKKSLTHEHLSRWLWFVGLYLLGVMVTALVAYAGRWLIRLK